MIRVALDKVGRIIKQYQLCEISKEDAFSEINDIMLRTLGEVCK